MLAESSPCSWFRPPTADAFHVSHNIRLRKFVPLIHEARHVWQHDTRAFVAASRVSTEDLVVVDFADLEAPAVDVFDVPGNAATLYVEGLAPYVWLSFGILQPPLARLLLSDPGQPPVPFASLPTGGCGDWSPIDVVDECHTISLFEDAGVHHLLCSSTAERALYLYDVTSGIPVLEDCFDVPDPDPPCGSGGAHEAVLCLDASGRRLVAVSTLRSGLSILEFTPSPPGWTGSSTSATTTCSRIPWAARSKRSLTAPSRARTAASCSRPTSCPATGCSPGT